MAIALKSVDDLQEHLLGVFQRSAHHAGEVNQVLLTIAGGILWRKNPGDAVKVNDKEGAGGNVIWFRIGSRRYALTYSHEERVIKLMEGGRRGELIRDFTNHTPTAEVFEVFAQLGDPEANAEAAKNAPPAKVPKKKHNGILGPMALALPLQQPVVAAPATLPAAAPIVTH